MRVIAGTLGGRIFDSPRTPRTHPMSDKARGGLFNTLGDIKGLSVLDAYGGSGAISFEAVSRGAKKVIIIDIDKDAYRTIIENIERLGIQDEIEAIRRQAGSWATGHNTLFFDIVICDPPYNDLRRDILQKVANRTTHGGLFVLSWPGKEKAPPFINFSLVKQNAYGDMQLLFYERSSKT